MNRKLVLATASATVLFALTAGASTASAATTHGLTCKSGSEPMRVMEKGRHVWRCEPMGHHASMKSHGTMAPQGGAMAPQGTDASGGTSY
jgi:hypothetical protein